MPDITKELAGSVVAKLRHVPKPPSAAFDIEIVAGKEHDIVKIRYRNIWIGQFGIQRGSKRDARHNYIASQLHLKRQQAYDLAKCPMSIDELIDHYVNKGLIAEK